jgi:hypothetical protein
MTGKAVGMSPKGDNAASDALPATVEELRAALNAIFEDARQQVVDLVDAYAHAAGDVCTTVHITERQLRSIKPAIGEAAGLSTKVDITEAQARDIKPVKRLYSPRATLYCLAQDAMEAFHAERGRRPSARELLERMPALDSDHFPVSLRLEGETIYWTDWSGEERTTSLKAFKNQIARIPL